mgnify:CR=1 FL=1
MNPYSVIIQPYVTEKGVRLVEDENKIVFIVRRGADKEDIRKAVELLYNVKVAEVNTLIDAKGKKRAYVKLQEGYSAEDIAMQVGVF